MRFTILLLVVLLWAACATGVATTVEPPISRAERARYAPDTTGGGFAPGALRQRILDVYDDRGNVSVSEYRDGDGELQIRFVNTYENGLKTRVDWRRDDGSLALYVLNAYDEEGRLVESVQYAPDGTLRRGFRSVWSDDGLHRQNGPRPTADEPFVPNAFYRLNERGEEVELLESPDIDSLRTLFTYDYPERDVYGNWTVRRTRRDGVPSQIETRRFVHRDVR